MDTLLDLCAAILLLTGGFLVMSLWFALIVFGVVEINDNRKERKRAQDEVG